jgi:hypothetical protein
MTATNPLKDAPANRVRLPKSRMGPLPVYVPFGIHAGDLAIDPAIKRDW